MLKLKMYISKYLLCLKILISILVGEIWASLLCNLEIVWIKVLDENAHISDVKIDIKILGQFF